MTEQTIVTKTARTGSAARMRRCRARRRAGFACYLIELHRSEVQELVRRGLLQADERDDNGAIVDALALHIEQTLGQP